MKRLALVGLLALAGCPQKQSTGTVDAAPPVASVEVDANLPWATEINMDAATAAPTVSQAAAAPAPTPAPAASAAPAYTGPLGTFTGNVKDSGGVYTITANITATGATVSYSAPLNCKARWTFKSSSPAASPTTYNYVEKITEQPTPPTCADNVPVILTKEPSVPNAYAYNAGGGQARALLKKL